MTEDEVVAVLRKVGAFRSGHFVFTSGLHSDTYITKDALYPHTRYTSRLCRSMAERFKDLDVEVVIGPAVAAAIISQWTAYHLSELLGKDILATYADKDQMGGFILKRGYDRIIQEKRTLVVEDLTTTGGSIKKVVDAIRAARGIVVGVGVLCNRGSVEKADIGNPPRFIALSNVALAAWRAAECDLCRQGVPVNTDFGHGAKLESLKKDGR